MKTAQTNASIMEVIGDGKNTNVAFVIMIGERYLRSYSFKYNRTVTVANLASAEFYSGSNIMDILKKTALLTKKGKVFRVVKVEVSK